MTRLFAIAEELRKLDVESSRLNWTKYTKGYDFGIMDIERDTHKKLKSRESWNTIQDLLARDISPLDRRRVEIMERIFICPPHFGYFRASTFRTFLRSTAHICLLRGRLTGNLH